METGRSRGMGRSTLCLRTGYRARVLINSEPSMRPAPLSRSSRRVVKDHLLPTLSRFPVFSGGGRGGETRKIRRLEISFHGREKRVGY